MGEHSNRNAETDATASWFTPWRFAAMLALMLVAAYPGIAFGTASWFKFDYGVLGYPFIQYHRDSFWRGELPLWNPMSNCGAPFLAQWGTMTLYPGALIYLLLPLPFSLNLFCLAHLLLGGVGMFCLARRWTGDSFAAAFAGSIFVFNGVMQSCLIWPNYLVALGWMPWLVLAAERAWREGGRWIILAALAGAMQMLSGSPEIVLFTWGLLGAMAAGLIYLKRVAPGPAVTRFAIIFAITTALCAAQLLPFLDLLGHSQRDRTFATSKWAMPGWGLGNLVVPLLHYFRTPQQTFFQSGQEFLASYYPGLVVLVLALVALWRMRQRRVWLLAGATVFVLIMAMGENGHLYSLFRKMIPVAGVARYPIKFVLVTVLTLPLLAAFGLGWLQRTFATDHRNATKTLLVTIATISALSLLVLWRGSENRLAYDQWPLTGQNTAARLVLAALFGVALFMVAAEKRKLQKTLFSAGLFFIPMADCLSHLPQHNPTVPTAAYSPTLAQEKFKFTPAPAPGQSRVFITPFAEEQLLRSNIPDMTNDFLVKHLALWSNLNALEGMPKVNGSSTLQIREQSVVQKLFYAATNVHLPALLDFLAVSHTTPTNNIFPWEARTNPLPWITAGQRPQFADQAGTLAALTNSAFDPRAEVWLREEARNLISATNAGTAKVSEVNVSAGKKSFTVQAESAAMVVIAETFYHPWQASVDGVSVPLWTANYAFQALQVPAGTHRVELRYVDQRFRMGMAISGLTLLGCMAGWRMAKRRG